MEAVWKTETEAGQSLYGGDFYNIDYFNKYHLLQASSFSCDHMHDGLGFMTQVRRSSNTTDREPHV
jgi:hypothetical protein